MKNARYVDERPLLTELPRLLPFSNGQFPLPPLAEALSRQWLPDEAAIRNLTELRGASPVSALLDAALLKPANELISNRGKRPRAKMVRLGSNLIDDPEALRRDHCDQWRICAEAIEFLHAGSLIVDDIEDGSSTRRGRPALHMRYGLPLALNAGNWLYFWPLELLRRLQLPAGDLQLVYELYHRTLLRAHFGQALDLGARMDTVPKREVEEVCLASMRLKTGALMGLAFALGAIVAGVRHDAVALLDQFGADFGVALQMFDDLGNVAGSCEPSKKYEDLMLYRPSWIWASVARRTADLEFEMFIAAVRALPDSTGLEDWFQQHGFLEKARRGAMRFIETVFTSLQRKLTKAGVTPSRRAWEELRQLGEEISIAYE